MAGAGSRSGESSLPAASMAAHAAPKLMPRAPAATRNGGTSRCDPTLIRVTTASGLCYGAV